MIIPQKANLQPLVVTTEQLRSIAPAAKNVDVFVPHLNVYMKVYDINTINRVAMFIAQVALESGSFRYTKEIWGPTKEQLRYERDVNQNWASNLPKNHRNRKAFELGNSNPGDGRRYLGRGLIQTTGKNNYIEISNDTGEDFVKFPELLETTKYAVLSACWFWDKRKLNQYADMPPTWRSETKDYTPFQMVTYRINGGQNGIKERTEFYNTALKVIR